MFSFKTFFAIQPMPAAKPVRVLASEIVYTSLLSDMIDIIKKNIFSTAAASPTYELSIF